MATDTGLWLKMRLFDSRVSEFAIKAEDSPIQKLDYQHTVSSPQTF
jgi:hypothetical protein